MTARVRLTHFELAAADVGKPPQPGRGHLHFSMDGGRFDRPGYSENGALAKKLGVAGRYSPSAVAEITYRNLPRGRHTLAVHLANNNHTATGIEAETTFTVR